MKKLIVLALRLILISILMIRSSSLIAQCTGFSATVNSITISPVQVNYNNKPTISASIKNTSSTTNGYGGAATFDIKVRITYPNSTYVESFVSPSVSFAVNETKTINIPTPYSTTAYGTYTVTYYVYNIPDRVCLFNSLSKTFQVVATPTISNTSPAASSTGCVNQSITFSLQANDAEGNLKMIEWYKDGVYTGTTHMVNGAQVTDSWSTSWSTAGSKTVTAIVYDQYPLSIGYTWNITINSTPGTPSLSSPADNSIYPRNTQISFSWGTVSGASSYNIQFDAETPVTSNSPYLRSWSAGGSHTWKVRANNTCGSGSYSVSRTVIINDPPTISNSSPSTPLVAYVNDSRTFSLTANDVDGNLKMCEWYYDDGAGYVYSNETDMISGLSQVASRVQSFTTVGTKYLKAIVYDQYDKTVAFVWAITVNPPTGNLQVNLKNKSGVLVGSGHKIFRYNSTYNYIDQQLTSSSGSVIWNVIPTGTYYAEAYTTYQQALWGDCFWGSAQGIVTTNTTTITTITQNQPVIEAITLNGGSFTPGSTVHVELQVRNLGTIGSEDCQVEIKIDKDKAAPWDYDPGIHGPVTINYGQLGYFGYDWVIPANISQGTYYVTARLGTKKTSGYVTTDVTGWDKSFTIINTSPSVSNISPASPLTVTVGDQVTFSLNASDPESNLKMCEWYFDDGSGYAYTNETDMITGGSASANFVKTFATSGSKKVKAIVYDQLNLTAVYEWFVTSNPLLGNAEVTLFDRNSVKVSSGNKLFRYNQAYTLIDSKTTDINGKSIWTNIPVGTYYFEGYNTTLQSIWGDLFWGALQSVVTKNQTTFTNIVQSEPYIESVTLNGNSFIPGSTIHVDVVVKNPSSVSKNCQTDIRIDKDKLMQYDFESGFHGPITIQPGQNGYFGFDWIIPANASSGTYYVAARVQTSFNLGFSNTDATNWNYSFQNDNSAISQISWSGYLWDVKNGLQGPGDNNWLANSTAVWVDGNGNLHLKIRKIGDSWYCSEISSVESFGFGEYTFQVSSRIDQLDKNVVLGLFTYKDFGFSHEPQESEIDIEFSTWNGTILPNNSQYVFQYRLSGNVNNPNLIDPNRFKIQLTGDYSTHKFVWTDKNILFQSYYGHYDNLPSNDFLINQFKYSDNRIPSPGLEKVHINLWLTGAKFPSNLQESEIILKSFTFKNSYAPSVTTGTANNISTQTADILGTVNPNGLATSVWVEYGTSASYGSSCQTQNISAGRNSVPLNFPLTGLISDKTYHYRVVASNSAGTSFGTDLTFSTKFAPILLNVPYYSQSDAGWCWSTSMSMLLGYYGFNRKPWEIAADFDKAKETGLQFFYTIDLNGFKNYLETYYGDGSGNSWSKETFWNNENLKQKIIQILKTGNPVWVNGMDINHAFIITGISGTAESDFVYFHDPDHVLVGYLSDHVNAKLTWNDFLLKIDASIISPNGDAIIVSSNINRTENHGTVSFQINPEGIQFANGYGLTVGSSRSIYLEWDGVEPYKGYKYKKTNPTDTWYLTDAELGYQATNADRLEIIPTISNYSNPLVIKNCRIEYQIFNSGNSLVNNETSQLFDVPGSGMADTYNYGSILPVVSIKDFPAGLYYIVLRLLDAQNQVQDQLQINFRVSKSDFADIKVINNSPTHQIIETGGTGIWQFTVTNLGSKPDYITLLSSDGDKLFQFFYQGTPITTTPLLLSNQSINIELRVPVENSPVVENKDLYTSFKPLNDLKINKNVNLKYSITNLTDISGEMDSNYKIYPNPAHNSLNIVSSPKEEIRILILDLNGKVFIDQLLINHSLDITNLPIGMYFLKIDNRFLKFIKY